MLSWRLPAALKERRGSRQNFYPSEWSFFPACTILSQNVLVCVCLRTTFRSLAVVVCVVFGQY